MGEAQVTNWAGNLTYSASRWASPGSVDEMQELVVGAAARGQRVRVIGTRHCFNDLADTDGLALDLRALPRAIALTVDGEGVVVDGGATYTEVNDVLAQHGRALANLASLPHISVAGAVATATHGSGDANPCLAAAVRAMTFVTPTGDLRTVRRGEPGFVHHPVHLGLFGPVVSLELDTVPAFDIATTVYEGLDFTAAIDHFDEMTHGLYSFSLAPNWADGGRSLLFAKLLAEGGGADDSDGGAVVGTNSAENPNAGDASGPAGIMVDVLGARAATTALHPSPGADPVAVTDQLGVAGVSHERLTHFRGEFAPSVGDEVQSEFFVSRETAHAALAVLPSYAEVFARLAHSMEIRSVAADDLTLSPFNDRPSVAIHLTWRRDVPGVMRELPALERALGEAGEVRPHWGKLFTTSPERLRQVFPGLGDVDALARRHDPDGIFRNPWSDRLLPSR